MKEGASFSEVAREIGVHRNNMAAWRQQHPEFDEACATGEMWAQGWWEKQARLGLFLREFNANLFRIVGQARFGYRLQGDIEVTHKGGVSLDFGEKVRRVNAMREQLLAAAAETAAERMVDEDAGA